MINLKTILIIGDIFTVIVVMAIGFAMHGETSFAFLPRFIAICLPLAVAWFLLAPWLGLFQIEITANAKQLWRPVFVAFFAGSMAVVTRGLILNSPIIPLFAVIASVTFAMGILLWRGIYFLIIRQS
jgi:hypothetical protein